MHLRIKTPARLHLGILDLSGDLGRIYGSIGVAVEKPNVVLEAKPSDGLNIGGGDSDVNSLVKRILIHYNLEPEIEIEIKERIPQHVGLGSGTQLALTLATAVTKIHGIDSETKDLARVTGRGSLSGIGIAAFERGGFIVDGGHKVNSEGIPPVIFRQPFPEDWGFIIAIPQLERMVHGQEEKEFFRRIIPSSPEISADICRLLQLKLLPSLIEKDIEEFGHALVEIDRKVGLFFKDVQDGIYREETSKQLVEFMLNSGFHGAGQSSWGPAVYGLVEGKEAMERESELEEFMQEKGINGEAIATKANNTGALISIL